MLMIKCGFEELPFALLERLTIEEKCGKGFACKRTLHGCAGKRTFLSGSSFSSFALAAGGKAVDQSLLGRNPLIRVRSRLLCRVAMRFSIVVLQWKIVGCEERQPCERPIAREGEALHEQTNWKRIAIGWRNRDRDEERNHKMRYFIWCRTSVDRGRTAIGWLDLDDHVVLIGLSIYGYSCHVARKIPPPFRWCQSGRLASI